MHSKSHLVVTVTLNPCVDTVLFVSELKVCDANRIQLREQDAGGKGVNLSRIVKKLGGQTMATGFIGGGTGALVTSVLDKENVPHNFVRVGGETRSNVSIETGNGPPTSFGEFGPQITKQELDSLVAEVKLLSQNSRWLAMGGSLPPGVPEDILCVLTEIGHAAKASVVLDSDGPPLSHGLKAGPDLIKPNRIEAEHLLGRSINGFQEAIVAARQIREHLVRSMQRRGYEPVVLISMDAKGAVMANQEGAFVGVGPTITARSSIGSGDSMLGAFIWAFEQEKSLTECFRWGLSAGAATAMTGGAEIGSREDMLNLFRQDFCGTCLVGCASFSYLTTRCWLGHSRPVRGSKLR